MDMQKYLELDEALRAAEKLAEALKLAKSFDEKLEKLEAAARALVADRDAARRLLMRVKEECDRVGGSYEISDCLYAQITCYLAGPTEKGADDEVL